MSDKPLVSIIINNYNYGRFLKEAIDSALNQTYEKIEVIVVDDGSTDDSAKIMEQYGDSIISVYQENGGQAAAYNSGFKKSNGEFICNLDADDKLFPHAIETAIAHFDKDVMKVQWPLQVVNIDGIPDGTLSTKWTPPEGDLREFILNEGPFYDFHLTTGSLLKRHFLISTLPMPEKPYRNGADVYLITLAPLFGRLRNVDQPLGTYRFHGKNNYRGKVLDDDRIKNYIERFDQNCLVLKKFATKLGFEADITSWQSRNFNYQWPTRFLKAKEDIKKWIPEGQIYLLINGNEWGEQKPVDARRAILFPSQNGVYIGAPENDESAIQLLNETINEFSPSHLVIWWTCYWWLESYPRFIEFLDSNHTKLLADETIIVYKLNSP